MGRVWRVARKSEREAIDAHSGWPASLYRCQSNQWFINRRVNRREARAHAREREREWEGRSLRGRPVASASARRESMKRDRERERERCIRGLFGQRERREERAHVQQQERDIEIALNMWSPYYTYIVSIKKTKMKKTKGRKRGDRGQGKSRK